MPTVAHKPAPHVEGFDEKHFYLDEFRGKTLVIALCEDELRREEDHFQLAAVVRELLPNDTRVIVLVAAADHERAEQVQRRLQRRLAPLIFGDDTQSLFPQRGARSGAFVELPGGRADADLLSKIWLTLRRGPLFVGIVPQFALSDLVDLAQAVAIRLRVHKLVLIDPAGGISGDDGKPLSFFDPTLLATLLAAGQAEWVGLGERRATLEAARNALAGNVSSVNLCTLDGLARELFTYTGSGTLFTPSDYCTVKRLGIDDFEEVEQLIERGQREGVLKRRSSDEVARLLVHGYGATIGAHHLAGFCALETETYRNERAGEVVALYTMTRFKGEGIGGQLLAQVLADARAAHLDYVFACTTEERAQSFFEREGFRYVSADDVPSAKWLGYDAQRKQCVAVLRKDLDAAVRSS